MARKGSRQKNGLDRNSSKEKQAVTEPMDAPFSDKRNNSNVHDRKMVDRDLPTAYPHRRSTSSSGEMVNNTNYVGDGDGTKQSYDDISCRAKSGNRTSNISQSVDMSSQVKDAARSDLLSDASELRTDDQILYRSTNNVRHTVSNMSEGVPMQNVMRDSGPSNAVMGRSFKSLSLHALEMAKGWFEQQQPYFKVFATIMKDAHSYVRLKIEHVYPIISTWILQFGKLMFVLSMVWLECSIRGLDSLLRLGTTSFLTVLSCSILSVTAMIGFTKMVIIMVIAALLVVFAGFAFASLIVAIFAIIILWFYGSFWTSGLVIVLGGSALALRHERVALLITTLYSMHCARSYVGWLGLLLGLNMAFILSDILVHILKTSVNESRPNIHPEQARQSQGSAGHFSGEPLHSSSVDDAGRSTDRSPGVPSTSGAETELTSDEEVVRLLNCSDHYSALGLNRFQSIDISYIKKEYRKKAMLVHPDKNMGNEKAVEAFKKLQNAYEVLLDSLKRKTYDDELRREELFSFIRRFQSGAKKNGRYGAFGSGFSHSTDEGSIGESRRIACKKCGDFHIWTRTERSKSRARWCQDCNDFHQAKDGDGWVEQFSQPLLFGLLQKMDPPCVYVCAESRIYDATEWFICQGMRCPPNSHKPSFHVNTSVTSKHSSAKATASSHRGGGGAVPTAAEANESMTEEEFFEWLQNAMQFEASSVSGESPAARNGSSSKGAPKKRKGKKQR